MPARVSIQVSKGKAEGSRYDFTEKETVILGRQSDCGLVLPENTVSRYHCMMEITPPEVAVRDFGSLNGTYLNGTVIGKRPVGMDLEEARNQHYNEVTLKAGDRLGLGKDCELLVEVYEPTKCAECNVELPEEGNDFRNDAGEKLCTSCYASFAHQKEIARKHAEEECARQEKENAERQEAERIAAKLKEKEQAAADERERAEVEAKRKEAERIAQQIKARQEKEGQKRAEEERKRREEEERAHRERQAKRQRSCEFCGNPVGEDVPEGVDVCTRCQQDPMVMLEYLLLQAVRGEGDAREIAGYKRIKSLGRGGMGEVWLVEEEATGQLLALKLMLAQVAASPDHKASFMREAYLAEQLVHKNVVRHFKSGNSGDTFFMLLELCDGGSVDKLMEKMGGKLPIDMATEIILQVLDGLDYAHHAQVNSKLADGSTKQTYGVVHRDFKPGNIFLMDSSPHPVAKVADFGLAKAFETAGLTKNTRTGQLAGTPAFMPRQQVLNFRYAKPDVDVWAAAASYYNMLTGKLPKDLFSQGDVWMAALSSRATPIREYNSQIPARLAEVIDEALVDNPSIGINTAAELKRRIEDVI